MALHEWGLCGKELPITIEAHLAGIWARIQSDVVAGSIVNKWDNVAGCSISDERFVYFHEHWIWWINYKFKICAKTLLGNFCPFISDRFTQLEKFMGRCREIYEDPRVGSARVESLNKQTRRGWKKTESFEHGGNKLWKWVTNLGSFPYPR